MFHAVFPHSIIIVSYLLVNCIGSISSVREERATFSTIVYL